MTYYNHEELKEKIAKQWDVTELLDALGLTMFELVELLSNQIEENKEELESMLDED